MNDFLVTLIYFLIALSILIAVHEYGHFWVARRMGVKVLRFSIGFGKPLWTRRAGPDQTEYVIAAVPLGGYVKMLDEREGEVPEAELSRAYNRQRVEKRFAIAAAGPLFNLAFAVFVYWLVFIIGMPGLKPIAGEVTPGAVAAAAGLRSGEELVAVGGVATPTWEAAIENLLPYALRRQTVAVDVRDGGRMQQLNFDFTRVQGEPDPEKLLKEVGVKAYRPPIEPVIDKVEPGSPAAEAGLRSGDRVTAIEGKPITDWQQLFDKVHGAPGKPLAFTILRDGAEVRFTLRPAEVTEKGETFGRIGAMPRVDPGLYDGLRGEWRHGPIKAVGAAVRKSWEAVSITLWSFKEMVMGRMSVKNISGPVTIAVYAKASANLGFTYFLSFLGLVSVSLAVLNLLPVPILDGGHLLFYVAEFIKGGPVSERVEMVGQKVGIGLILTLMTIALYNDLARWLG